MGAILVCEELLTNSQEIPLAMNCGRASRGILAVLTKLKPSSSTKQSTMETTWMPVCQPHGLDHEPSEKLSTESAAQSKQHLEVLLAVLLDLKLIQEPEARCTHKALLLVEYPIAVDDLLYKDKLGLAGLAHGIRQVFRHVASHCGDCVPGSGWQS